MNLTTADMMSLIKASHMLLSEEIGEGGLVKVTGNVDGGGEIGKVIQTSQTNYGVEMLTGDKKGKKLSFSKSDIEEIVLDSLNGKLDDETLSALEDGDADEEDYEALKEIVSNDSGEEGEEDEQEEDLPNQYVLEVDKEEAGRFSQLLDDSYKTLSYDQITPSKYGFDEFQDLYNALIKGIEEEEIVTLSSAVIHYKDEEGSIQKKDFERDDLGELYNFYDELKNITKDDDAPKEGEQAAPQDQQGMI